MNSEPFEEWAKGKRIRAADWSPHRAVTWASRETRGCYQFRDSEGQMHSVLAGSRWISSDDQSEYTAPDIAVEDAATMTVCKQTESVLIKNFEKWAKGKRIRGDGWQSPDASVRFAEIYNHHCFLSENGCVYRVHISGGPWINADDPDDKFAPARGERSILDEAAALTAGDSGEDATRIAMMWSAITGATIQPRHVPLMMVGIKLLIQEVK